MREAATAPAGPSSTRAPYIPGRRTEAEREAALADMAAAAGAREVDRSAAAEATVRCVAEEEEGGGGGDGPSFLAAAVGADTSLAAALGRRRFTSTWETDL